MEKFDLDRLSISQAKALKRFVIAIFVLAVLGLLGALNGVYERHNPDLPYTAAKKQSRDPMAVVRHQSLNGNDLDIPVPYFKTFAPPDGDQEAILLIVMYPEFGPIMEDYTELWRKGEWYRNVMILILTPIGKMPIPDLYVVHKRTAHATEQVEEAFGLLHHISSEPGIWPDLYVVRRDQQLFGFIKCSAMTAINSQCVYYLKHSGAMFQLTFDKDLLPFWQEIETKTLGLFESFKQ